MLRKELISHQYRRPVGSQQFLRFLAPPRDSALFAEFARHVDCTDRASCCQARQNLGEHLNSGEFSFSDCSDVAA